ncbi:MAG: ATP-binding cassette domain-containing protein [Candidatus Firestonebacteria bacterium]
MKNVIEFNGVSKKLIKGEKLTSLRDVFSCFFSRLLGRSSSENPDAFWALKGIDLKVKPGEALGIIGENGAGKTTMLKLIAGIMRPNEGELLVSGRVASLIELGAGFHPDLTGRENIYLCGSIMGMKKSKITSAFSSIAGFAGIGEFLDTPVKRYSMGMFVRLGFSVVMHLDTDIMLIDEVLAVGDLNFQAKCREALDRFKEQGKTIIFVSHDMGSVINLCTKVVWLSKGRIMEAGEPQKVVNSYINHSEKVGEGAGGLVADREWLTNYDPGKFVKEPRGIAWAPDGRLLAASLQGHCVAVFSGEGKFLGAVGEKGIGEGKIYSPAGIAVSGSKVFVSDVSNGCVLKYDSEGSYLGVIKGVFSEPFGVYSGGDGGLIVTDRKLHKVFELSCDGRVVNVIGSKGSGNGEFNFPISAALDGEGFLYVSDLNNHRVQVFDKDRKFTGSFGGYGSAAGEFNGPHDIVIEGKSLFIADHINKRIKKYNISGIPGKPELEVIFNLERSMLPCGIACGEKHELYVSFGGTAFIGKYTFSGQM